ncbi:MAG TPA: hypothetical protein VGP64_17230 [Polyangia bacterium]|jgi:hypothetical protein
MTFAFRGLVGLWGVAMLLAGLPACGSSSGKCTTNCKDAGDGKHDADGKQDADGSKKDMAVDRGAQMDMATTHDGALDGPRDARHPVDLANPCAESLTAACSETRDGGGFSLHCASTWDATTHNTYLCARPATTVLISTCGDFRELIDTNGSEEYVYVYDAAGELVAVSHVQYQEGGTFTRCVGGSAGFVDPQGCTPSTAFSCPKDGGTHN